MRTRWKVTGVLLLVALVGTGIVAGVALADGSRAATPATTTTATTGAASRAALDRLLTCAKENGVVAAVQGAAENGADPASLIGALTAVGACQDEARALMDAAKADGEDPGALARSLLAETATCLDAQGVTLSGLAAALTGDESAQSSVEDAAAACVPELGSLID